MWTDYNCSFMPQILNVYNEGNYKQGKKAAFRMGENNNRWNNWQRIYLQNIQAAHAAQFSSVAQLCLTLCDPMDCSMPGLPVYHQLLEFTQTPVHWLGDAIQLSHLLSSLSPPAFNLSQQQGLLKWVSSSHEVAKILEFQFSVSSFNERPGLISFRMDWLDLLAVQGTLKSLLQHHS